MAGGVTGRASRPSRRRHPISALARRSPSRGTHPAPYPTGSRGWNAPLRRCVPLLGLRRASAEIGCLRRLGRLASPVTHTAIVPPHRAGPQATRYPGKLVTQRQLLAAAWDPAYTTETRYLRPYMTQLRRKLELNPARPRHLLTESGMGYLSLIHISEPTRPY